VDYVGRETAMIPFNAGDVEIFGLAQASELVRLGVAVEYVPEKPKKEKVNNDTDK